MSAELPPMARCHTCKHTLSMGEPAWAQDWTVVDGDDVRTEVRYTCDDCAAAS